MLETVAASPVYAEKFRCIGSDCEETCCTGFQVDIDLDTFMKYQTMPPGFLRTLIDERIVAPSEQTRAIVPSAQAWIKLLPSNTCPFLNKDRLCQIQVELGESYLSSACSSYPRSSVTINNVVDRSLILSCPEASRIVLLDPNLLETCSQALDCIDADISTTDPTLVSQFWPIRKFVVGLLKERSYPLWQRMFLLGTFTRRLEAVMRGEIEGGLASMLNGFSAAVALGSLRPHIETLPADLPLQLGLVLELVKIRYSKIRHSKRLSECIDDFSRGIGFGPEATIESMAAEYGAAYHGYFEPFFDSIPTSRDYLINAHRPKMFLSAYTTGK